MKSWFANINGIFCALIVACFVCGCKTTEEKQRDKAQTLIRLHLEVNPDGSKRNQQVPIYRARPEVLTIQNTPFIDSTSIQEANVVEMEGGFGIRVQFDLHGARVLENVTASNVGKRLAVYAVFPQADLKAEPQARWLAAPRIGRRISDGLVIFTPDATREECDRIVLGINNLSKKLKSLGRK